ncbi:MAG: hypothetical protein AAFO91_19285, partial [Bacteroidota bacterium]
RLIFGYILYIQFFSVYSFNVHLSTEPGIKMMISKLKKDPTTPHSASGCDWKLGEEAPLC